MLHRTVPRSLARRRFYPGAEWISERVQDVSLERFLELAAGDVLFVDSSHVVNLGGDVTHLLLEVIPRIAAGVVVHMHDVFLPRQYPEEWFTQGRWFWNEQYCLQAFLAFNQEFEVMLANAYLGLKYSDELKRTFPKSPWWAHGGSVWMKRV